MRILLTGSAGYVGSALLPKLRAAGHTVTEVDLLWFDPDWEHGSPSDVRELVGIGDNELIIHLAAVANDPSVAFYPRLSWETTVLATRNLADLAWRSGARFIYASSVSVYGANQGQVEEDQVLKPLSDYNKTKMCAERILLSYPIDAQIVRPATICGLSPRMRLDLTVNMLTMQALTKGKMTVFGGRQMRPSIHIDDMTDLYLWLIDHPEVHGIYNAGWENHSVLELAWRVKEKTDAVIEVTDQKDARSYRVNSAKLLAAGFEPSKTVDNAIDELIEAYAFGKLKDEPQWYNLGWMQSQEIKDE